VFFKEVLRQRRGRTKFVLTCKRTVGKHFKFSELARVVEMNTIVKKLRDPILKDVHQQGI